MCICFYPPIACRRPAFWQQPSLHRNGMRNWPGSAGRGASPAMMHQRSVRRILFEPALFYGLHSFRFRQRDRPGPPWRRSGALRTAPGLFRCARPWRSEKASGEMISLNISISLSRKYSIRLSTSLSSKRRLISARYAGAS